MAAPILQVAVNKLGKTFYKRAGRFVSKNVYLRESRRIKKGLKRAGKFVSRAEHARSLDVSGIARQLLAEMGPPVGDANWVSRVKKSAELFTDLLADDNQLG